MCMRKYEATYAVMYDELHSPESRYIVLELVDGTAPEALQGLAAPDAIFVGGGLTDRVFEMAWHSLKPLGRFVSNAVTLESEEILLGLHNKYGGELVRLAVTRAEPVGPYRGWRPSMPVTQWSLIKR